MNGIALRGDTAVRLTDLIPRAVVYLRKDLSPCWQWHETQCKSLARRYGYTVDRTIWFTGRDRARMSRLLHECQRHRCEAVFVPSLDHLDPDATLLLSNGLQITTVEGYLSDDPESYDRRTAGVYEILRARPRPRRGPGPGQGW